MNLDIQSVSNGWLVVVSKSDVPTERSVFIDRQKMLDYLDENIPPTGDEQGFIDGIDGTPKEKTLHLEKGDMLRGDFFDKIIGKIK